MKGSSRDRGEAHAQITAVVLTWNKFADTRDCIESLLALQPCPPRLVVVDNASTDGSAEQLQRAYASTSGIQFVFNSRNLGFASGVNVGVRIALEQGCDYVLLLNNDAIVGGGTVRLLEKAAESDPSVGIVGPRILYHSDDRRIWHGGGYFSGVRMGVVVPEKGKLAERCGTETREARFLTGCAMLIKREVFETVGLFDEDFFLYEEDLDFCLRAARAEYRLVYEPAALVWHKISPVGGDRTSPTVMYHRARSRILMLRKDFPRIRCMYGFLLHVLVYTPVRFLQISRGTRTLDSARAWLGGTWAGIRFPISSSGGAHEAIK